MASLEILIMALLFTLCYCQPTVLNKGDPIESPCVQYQIDTMMHFITELRSELNVAKQEREKLKTELAKILKQQNTTITTNHKRYLDCGDIYKGGQRSNGVYKVYPIDVNNVQHEVQVYCDMTTSGGGWTVFQRRFDGSVPFNRTWEEYKNGFGNILGELWLGNNYISMMTNSLQTKYRLRVDLTAFDGQTRYAEYTNFKVAPETAKYRLSIGTYSGTAGDGGSGLSYHNNQYFSTMDRDNDQNSGSCSHRYGYGGFWYKDCYYVNLNGVYNMNAKIDSAGIRWYPWLPSQVLQTTTMMFKPMTFP